MLKSEAQEYAKNQSEKEGEDTVLLSYFDPEKEEYRYDWHVYEYWFSRQLLPQIRVWQLEGIYKKGEFYEVRE